ncbi:hypothetical protein [Deinococcus soli (ex Cha et al. 2016)]|uniref:hypothetical protein n=1 Tax=Deinococcus soli (ex Cha et al. 2016) TaxID=1309411 RepID=UPI00166C41A1|nr:hypothetical protein [Deinococcus soli (ex Cha et al. 2016)]
MTLPPAVDVDLSLACCPACAHERVVIDRENLPRLGVARLTVSCALCLQVEPLGWSTRKGRYLFPWALRRWGLA